MNLDRLLKRMLLALLFLALPIWGRAEGGNAKVPIGQPTVFWRENQWQTFQDGRWMPYAEPIRETSIESETSGPGQLATPPEPDTSQTNVFIPDYGYGWGFGLPNGRNGLRHHPTGAEQRRRGKRADRLGRPNIGIGQTTIGIGQPNTGIGRTTIGIGKPNVGLGQTTIGIGQPTVGIGRPTIGIGQTTIGIGRPMGSHSPQIGSDHQGTR